MNIKEQNLKRIAMQYLSRTNLPTDGLICFAISAGCTNFKWVLQHYGGFRNVCITKQIFPPISFPFIQKPTIQNMTKTLIYLLFLVFSIEQLRNMNIM
jgi:hypothetical protein